MANISHLEIIGQGSEVWNKWRADEIKIIPDLSGADISRAYLRGIDLNGANLSAANFSQVDLSRANLSGADLCKAKFFQVDLSQVWRPVRKLNPCRRRERDAS